MSTQTDAALDALESKVQPLTDAVTAMKAYILGFADLVASEKNNPARIADIANKVQADIDAIVGSITQNTPTPPEPEPPAGGRHA